MVNKKKANKVVTGKTAFIERLRLDNNLDRAQAEKIYETFLDLIQESLTKDVDVRLKGIGQLIVRDRAERVARNPQTGERLLIPKRKAVYFHISRPFQQELNDGAETSQKLE